MRVGLLSYHAEFATSAYFAKAIVEDGHELIRLGLSHPASSWNPAPMFDDLLPPEGIDLLLFVDPPGPVWPMGWEVLACPTVGYLIDVHQSLDIRLKYAPFVDHAMIAQRDYLREFHSRGFESVEWLPPACDPDTHNRPSGERSVDVGFVGKLGARGGDRQRTLQMVLNRYATNDYGHYYSPKEMSSLYAQCKIVFNKSINGDLNMRVFEAMASGALLVTDRIDNGINQLFEEGVHYVGYATVAEAIDRIDYFLSHERDRQQIAIQGQRRACGEHTYRLRWRQILDLVLSSHTRRAPVRKMTRKHLRSTYASVYESIRRPSGVLRLAAHYGPSADLVLAFGRASAKVLNAVIPLSPGAIRARLTR